MSKSKTTQDRILDSFVDADNVNVTQYIAWVRDMITDCATNMRRLVLIFFLLIAAFEIVVGSPGTTIGIGSFKISKGSVVLLFLPAIAAYLQLQLTLDAKRFQSLTSALHTTFACWSLPGYRNDVDFFIRPVMPVYWNISGLAEKVTNRPPLRKFELIASAAFTASVIFGMLAFQTHAYYVLFSQRHSNIVLCTISLLASAFFLSLAYIIFSMRAHQGGSIQERQYYYEMLDRRLSSRNSGGAAFDVDPGAVQEEKAETGSVGEPGRGMNR